MTRVAFLTFALAAVVLGLSGPCCLAADDKASKGADNIAFASFSRDDNNTQHVFYRNNDGHILELYAKHGDHRGWNSKDLSAESKAPRAAGSPACYFMDKDNTQHVIYRGDDGSVHEIFLADKGTRWAHNNLTQQASAPKAAGDPTGYVALNDHSQHVFYRSTDGDMIELFNTFKGDRGWQHKNLMTGLSAPKAAGDPSAFFLKFNNSQHVFYRDKDGQVHELFLGGKSDRWGHANLTQTTKAPKADGCPCGYAMTTDNTQHVVYRSADGDIIELFHKPEGKDAGWQSKNLTQEAKAPKAVGDPASYFVKDNKTQHVFYRDKDGQIQELYLKQDRWAHNNLSAQTKAPKAVSDPSGYYLDKNNTQHVIFRADDGKICELYHVPTGDDPRWHLNNLPGGAKPN